MSNVVVIHLGCLNKVGCGQIYVFRPTTQLSPSPRNMWNCSSLWLDCLSCTRQCLLFWEVSLCSIPACDERVGWQVERTHTWAHGSWKGFFMVTHSLSTLQLAVRELFSIYESSRRPRLVEMQAQCYKTSLFASLSHHHRKNWVEIGFWWNFFSWQRHILSSIQ